MLDADKSFRIVQAEQAVTDQPAVCRLCGKRTVGSWQTISGERFRAPRAHRGWTGRWCEGSKQPAKPGK